LLIRFAYTVNIVLNRLFNLEKFGKIIFESIYRKHIHFAYTVFTQFASFVENGEAV
jgi:hypothetical protein